MESYESYANKPYVFKEYPKHITTQDGKTIEVNTPEQEEAALSAADKVGEPSNRPTRGRPRKYQIDMKSGEAEEPEVSEVEDDEENEVEAEHDDAERKSVE